MKLSRDQRKALRVIISSKNRYLDIVQLALVANLDPRSCFAGGDWRGVDFGRHDVSAFDFTGADVSGADFSQASGVEQNDTIDNRIKIEIVAQSEDLKEFDAAKSALAKHARHLLDQAAVKEPFEALKCINEVIYLTNKKKELYLQDILSNAMSLKKHIETMIEGIRKYQIEKDIETGDYLGRWYSPGPHRVASQASYYTDAEGDPAGTWDDLMHGAK